jgi:hypothetical protein
MATHYTYAQIATDFQLWIEYVDTDANMTEEEFDTLSTEAKVQLQVEAFGPETGVETMVRLDGQWVAMDVARNLMDDDLCEQIHGTVETEQEFLDAYLTAHRAKFGEDFVVN